jgi:hypothetical protein
VRPTFLYAYREAWGNDVGEWDDMIASRQADAERDREFIDQAEAGEWVMRHRDAGGERDVLQEEIDSAKQRISDAEKQIARLKMKNV